MAVRRRRQPLRAGHHQLEGSNAAVRIVARHQEANRQTGGADDFVGWIDLKIHETENLLIGALLRVPAQAIQRRLIKELNAAGFDELRLPHMAVLQFPGPDGARPGTIAERAGMSKQAINQLLSSLEGYGYLVRSDIPGDGGARVVRSTERGHAAFWKMVDILRNIEEEWRIELGPERFAQLKALLFVVWESPLAR
ncbi:MarR family winged helix-turn-helix transcriptional regulator [Mesorhizobium sp. CO1-1-8]|uniref:MarR family winged helix-turn-helix transcriptional regulator n=1 Tax=Mesorhizobium sp. CO1-1-8 TaxID=2876631 RepID=UPI001CD07595|nr:MarR family winged helix-turn-helix transcriptional regulator [Mesorhizobium sp. CO1-1-8]MBZ9775413.1 MarR family winged helix-turn-helix transcriptional regulator [Mesorhizobium sp. CO1-1-8]